MSDCIAQDEFVAECAKAEAKLSEILHNVSDDVVNADDKPTWYTDMVQTYNQLNKFVRKYS